MNPRRLFVLAALSSLSASGRADAVDALRDFAREVRSARAEFVQTVTSPDGARKKISSGSFEFARPNRFRFAYRKPFEQLIVGDGRRVWLYDVDLNQVTVRPFDQALSATPAALLAGAGIERDFELAGQPLRDGLEWVSARPRARDGGIEALSVGFRNRALAVIEISDAFGQRSRIEFTQLATNVAVTEAAFEFVPPKGADVIEQK